MGYRVISMRGSNYGRKSSGVDEFYEAMDMAKEGLKRVCDLAEEMVNQYSERGGAYGGRHGYSEREEWDDNDMYGERRRRDSRGRYM